MIGNSICLHRSMFRSDVILAPVQKMAASIAVGLSPGFELDQTVLMEAMASAFGVPQDEFTQFDSPAVKATTNNSANSSNKSNSSANQTNGSGRRLRNLASSACGTPKTLKFQLVVPLGAGTAFLEKARELVSNGPAFRRLLDVVMNKTAGANKTKNFSVCLSSIVPPELFMDLVARTRDGRIVTGYIAPTPLSTPDDDFNWLLWALSGGGAFLLLLCLCGSCWCLLRLDDADSEAATPAGMFANAAAESPKDSTPQGSPAVSPSGGFFSRIVRAITFSRENTSQSRVDDTPEPQAASDDYAPAVEGQSPDPEQGRLGLCGIHLVEDLGWQQERTDDTYEMQPGMFACLPVCCARDDTGRPVQFNRTIDPNGRTGVFV